MIYNEIYELVKPIYQWMQENYPNDKYLMIDKNSVTLCDKGRTIDVNYGGKSLREMGTKIPELSEALKTCCCCDTDPKLKEDFYRRH